MRKQKIQNFERILVLKAKDEMFLSSQIDHLDLVLWVEGATPTQPTATRGKFCQHIRIYFNP